MGGKRDAKRCQEIIGQLEKNNAIDLILGVLPMHACSFSVSWFVAGGLDPETLACNL